ncbi:ExeM/NucH family extracellular endonuclease [Blastochloris tepida]|uniref:5'-nucleotidase n=1 Tax=Blastochloris tepida TaxID=2233851 RepID=A0A348G241_9HYPH|nr:ExeM/NucH family extracellular endonuclease [Blastochloris tepida]BBF93624.1 hypothetical protein BLTE_23090 [Blastochloris tepida]
MSTTLSAGDIAIIGMNADNPDDFSFVLLTDVTAGTEITFTDSGWKASGGFRANEGAKKWTAATDLSAGTVINFTADAAQFTTANDSYVGTSGLSLSTDGDQLIAFQGTSSAPTLLFALSIHGNAFSDATDAQSTALPAGLVENVTALARGAGAPGDEWDNVVYTGPTSGTKTEILAAIGNAANWSGSNSSLTQITADFAVTSEVASQTVGFADGSLSVSATEGDAGTTVFTFTVERSGGTTGEVSFSGTVALAGADAADFAGGAPTTFSGTIPAGANSATVTVSVAGDTVPEDAESFSLTLTTVANDDAAIDISIDSAAATAQATILDDDAAIGVDVGGITILDMAESLQGSVETPVATESLTVTRKGGWVSGDGAGGAESIAFDAANARAYVTNAAADKVSILDLSNPFAPTKIGEIDLSTLPAYGEVNSVAVKNGIIAVAVQNIDGGESGLVALYDATGTLIKTITVGVLPDQLTFNKDGTLLLVANEAEPYNDTAAGVIENASGSVTIIDMSGGAATADVRNTIGFTALDGSEALLATLGIKTYTGTAAGAVPTASQDIEPEYIAVSPDGTKAYVTLQEVDAVAVIDLADAAADKPVSILPLGYVDFSLPGNEADFSDRDGAGNTASISVGNDPVKGLLQPDAIASFEIGGVTYFITANEGDSRIVNGGADGYNEARASAVTGGTAPADYARLNLDTTWSSATDLYSFGGRGFSIFQQNDDGTIVKIEETGGDFEQIIAALPNASAVFNGENGGGFDTRSDNKGAEPEGVAVGEVNGKTYAFVALERIGGIMVWDVSTPSDAKYVTYLAPTSEDYGPEVITFVSAADSPTGRAFVMTANEVSGSVTVYDLEDPAVTKISAIQGEGASSAMAGQTVTVEAIVVGDFQNGDADGARNLNGFYLQEEAFDADGNPLTSEGIFIYGGSVDVNVGDRVRVTGKVSEYYGLTEITASSITVLEANAVADINTMAVEIDLPAADATLSQDGDWQPDLEAYEGMLVTIPETLTVTEQYNLDRFNEIKLVAGERPEQFTQENAPDAEAYQAYLQALGARTITYDDGLNVQNTAITNLDGFGPVYNTDTAPRMGDTVTGLTGVLDYQWAGNSASGATWRVRSVEDGTNTFEDGANARTDTPADVGGDLKVACFNVLNYFVTLDNGATTAIGAEPRGANTAEEFARQTDKLVNALIAIDADVLALIELENDFREGSSGNAIEYLVDELNAVLGAGTYDWVRPGQQFVGTDAIAVGFIYKPSVVEVSIGTTIEILDDSDLAALGLGDLLGLSTVGGIFDGANTSRNALAVTFTELATGEEFTAIANHLKSKSGSGTGADADQLDGQGAWQNQRELAATALTAWAASDPTGSGDTDILLLGDFNAYAMEDAIGIIEDAGYEDLQAREGNAYSYVFDGQTGTLDYIFASTSLASQVTGVTTWHINADEADALDYNTDYGRDTAIYDADTAVRVSDHDPLIIGLDLTETPQVTYTLQILHASDFEAGLKAVDRAGNFAAIVDYLEETYANSITLSSGDNFIPSPFFSAGSDASLKEVYETALETYYGLPTGTLNISPGFGTADMTMLDIIGVQASAIGNHEFDAGTKAFADIIKQTATYPGAQFPYLAANLTFSGDSNLASVYTGTIQDAANYSGFPPAATIGKKIAPATIIEEGGEKIGIVGATTQIVEAISSTGGVEVIGDDVNDMAALAAILQPTIDALLAQGINKIILVSHLQQLALEQELAPLLHGVDVIVAGGSHTLLADEQDTLRTGDSAAGEYPIVTTNADGKTTLIVNTDGEYSYVGRLVVDFDENGDVVYTPNTAVNGAYATTDEVVDSLYADVIDVDADGDIDADDANPFAEGSRGDLVDDIAQAVGAVIDAQDGNIFGSTDVYLEGRRSEARTEETNLGDLTADANLWYAQKVDATVMVSIKNGGGIRDSIGTVYAVGDDAVESPPVANAEVGKQEGDVSQLDIANSLRFNNSLSLVTVTAAQLLLVLEHAVAATTATATPGQFAQIGGIAFSFDKDLPAGNRVLSAAILNDDGVPAIALVANGELVVDADMAIRVVTLSFLLTGGDSYPFASFIAADPAFANVVNLTPDLVPDAGQVATFAAEGTEQDAFAEYMAATYSDTPYAVADTDRANDTRIQNLDYRGDTVLQAAAQTVHGDAGNNTLTGALGNDILWDGTGNDTLIGYDGNDYLIGGAGADVLVGGAGIDTAVFSTAGSGVTVNLATGRGSGGDAEGDTYDSIEQIIGSAYGDTLTGDDGDNVFQAGAGNDTVNGGGGNDIIYAGAGADAQNGGAGIDRVVYSASATGVTVNLATAQGSGGDAEGDTFSGIEQVIGSEHADTLIGDGADNALKGGAGNDRLDGGTGNDILIGDAGADTFVFNAGFGIDQVKDFAAGTDKIEFSTEVFADFAAVQAAMVDTGSGYLAIWADYGTNGVGLWGVTAAQLTADDFRFV